MRAVDLMTPNPYVVTPDEPLLHAAQLMRDHDLGCVPVVENREHMRLRGVITDRDITIRHVAEAHHHDCAARDVMTPSPLDTIRPTDDVDRAMRLMRRDAIRRVLVTTDDGRLLGVIATADLLRHAAELGRERVEGVLEDVSQPVALAR